MTKDDRFVGDLLLAVMMFWGFVAVVALFVTAFCLVAGVTTPDEAWGEIRKSCIIIVVLYPTSLILAAMVSRFDP